MTVAGICINCSLFDPQPMQPNLRSAMSLDPSQQYGLCRCYPPPRTTLTIDQILNPTQASVDSQTAQQWPLVAGDDWCGQYKPSS